MSSMKPQLMRIDDVLKVIDVSRTTLYSLLREGDFPPPVRVSKRNVRWRQEDVQQWLDSRPLSTTHELLKEQPK